MAKPDKLTVEEFNAQVAEVKNSIEFVGMQADLSKIEWSFKSANEYGAVYANSDDTLRVTISASAYKALKVGDKLRQSLKLESTPSTTKYTAQSYKGWTKAKVSLEAKKVHTKDELKKIFDVLYATPLDSVIEYKMTHKSIGKSTKLA